MKRVKNLIKLTNLNSESLNEKELNQVIAGEETVCMCGCYYSECGGSAEMDNADANSNEGLYSEVPFDQAEWNGIG